ncbi:MAG: fasciclin domain-containing protein [Pseudomonadota bacterium]
MLKKSMVAIAALAASLALTAAPSKAASIVETAQQAGQFNTLLAAAQAAGLATPLATSGPLTVFAPTDEAFAALPAGTVENLLKPENKDQLAAILSYHVLPRKLTSNMLPGRTIHVKTIKAGGDRLLAVTKSGGGVTVDNATVVAADIAADNGVIHVIDTVMLPDS